MDPHEHLRPESEPYHQILERAAQDWDLVSSRTHLLRNGLNHVYAAQGQLGEDLIVRISDGAHRTALQIEGELSWLDHLSRHRCAVPRPVRTADGKLLETFEHKDKEYHVGLFEKLDGDLLLPEPKRWLDPKLQRQFGKMIGRMHRASDSLELPAQLKRRHWYEDTEMMMPANVPKVYDEATADMMFSHQHLMEEFAAEADPNHYGLCHRDVHCLNMLYDKGKIWLLDFELGCYCWRMVDLSISLLFLFYLPLWKLEGTGPKEAHDFLRHVVEGYREEHTLESEQLAMLPDLMRLRETLCYVVTMPELEKWQEAIPMGQCTMEELFDWIEERWQHGFPEYELDVSGI